MKHKHPHLVRDPIALECVDIVTLLDWNQLALGVLHGVAVLAGNLVTPPQRHPLALPREALVAVLGVFTGLHVILLALKALSLVTFLPLSSNI